jgi:Uma2 family endonuclease
MGTMTTAVPLDEYLHTVYEPDCDYVDGVLEERNVGQKVHSETQVELAAYFSSQKKRLKIRVATELRMQVSPTRVRIPDVTIVPFEDRDEIQVKPPLLCIEILSPDDRLGRLLKIVSEYLAFGVPMIWIIDPYEREAFVVTQENRLPQVVDELRWNDVILKLSDILPE